MQCPYCRENDDKVVDSRGAEEQTAIRRRRECLACGRRFTTYERVEDVPMVVRKRSGEAEPFDRAKLRSGIASSATGRLDDPTIDLIVGEVEEELRSEGAELGSDRLAHLYYVVRDGRQGVEWRTLTVRVAPDVEL